MKNNLVKIRILDFSDDPWGRDAKDNSVSSGERFRIEFLRDPLRAGKSLFIDFNGLDYLPDSAFLGGAFVDLVKIDRFTYDRILSDVDIIPEEIKSLVVRQLNTARNQEAKQLLSY